MLKEFAHGLRIGFSHPSIANGAWRSVVRALRGDPYM
jgi:hypothetical protein